jgi:hypothetical protein
MVCATMTAIDWHAVTYGGARIWWYRGGQNILYCAHTACDRHVTTARAIAYFVLVGTGSYPARLYVWRAYIYLTYIAPFVCVRVLQNAIVAW